MENRTITDWILDHLLWEILLLIVVVILPSIFHIVRVSVKLLSQNRDTRGNSWGLHLADRFIDMWYSTDKNPLHCFGDEMYKLFDNPNSRHTIRVIDERLHKYKLVERDNSTYNAIFKPVRNWKNRIILIIIELWLVYIAGDNHNLYNDLKKKLKNNK